VTWAYLIVMIVVLILGIALAPKAQGPNSAEIDDFDFPTAEEGRPIPVVFGEVDIRGSNVLWYGDLRVQAIRKRSGFSKTTVGHKYYIGWHAGLCHGPVDAITNILVGEKQAWSGNATGNTTIGINEPDLFGGEKREGGISGGVDICMGGPTQTANSYLSTKLASAYPGIPVTAFRGITCLVAKQMYIGTSAYPKVWAVRTRRILEGWQDDLTWYDTKAVVDTVHMNPAHIVYQCLTDTRWGMGVDYSLIDTDSFEAVADQLFTENFGMSVLWNQSESIEKFVQIILDHIAGGLTLNNSTGKYELLLVRGDYDVEALEIYDESDIVRVTDYQRQGWGETVNEVTLVYTDPKTRKDTNISQQDIANIDAQGARIPQIIKLKGIHNHDVARTVLARELVSRVTPLSKVTFEINRRAWATRYGGLFKLVYAPRNINGTVYRVLKATKGTITKNTIKIEALEDIYALGVNSSLETPDDAPDDENPPPTPTEAVDTGVNVISTSETTPPTTPADGDSYLIPGDGTATGVWAGHEGQVADYDLENDEWIFTDVPDNTLVFDESTNSWHSIIGGVAEEAPWRTNATYITVTDETSGLPNSRRLVAVSNITLDTATAGQIKISATGKYTRGATFTAGDNVIALPTNDVPVRVPVSGTITKVSVLTTGGSGNCVIDIRKKNFASFPPVGADSICASAKPTLSGVASYEDVTLTGWTTAVSAGDTLMFVLESSSVFKTIGVSIEIAT
jgi:hypothetical protein